MQQCITKPLLSHKQIPIIKDLDHSDSFLCVTSDAVLLRTWREALNNAVKYGLFNKLLEGQTVQRRLFK